METQPLSMGYLPLEETQFDAVIVGGGPAGLAAAIALARSRRRVVVVDAGQPRNARSEGAHNVLGQEGIKPLELLAKGRAEARDYGVRFVKGKATAAFGAIDDFTVELDEGADRVRGRRIILATGLEDDLPDIPGVREGWGHSVLHCPFCHGWEVRGQQIAVISREEIALHQAMLFAQLSDHVTVFLNDAKPPSSLQQDQLDALGVQIVPGLVEELIVADEQVQAVVVEGGRTYAAQAAVVVPRFNSRSELYEALGGECAVNPYGRQIPADPRGATAVPGVWSAGNASDLMAMVVAAAGQGVATGAAVHGDLCLADLESATKERNKDY